MTGEAILWSPGVTLEQIEKQVILKAYKFYRNNKTATSIALGISIRTLDTRLEKYELDAKENEKAVQDERTKREAFLARARGHVTINEQTGTSVLGATAGIHVESPSQPTAQQEMPMPKRRKV